MKVCGRCHECKEVAHSILSTTARSDQAQVFYRRLQRCVELNNSISEHQLWCNVCRECGIAGDDTEKKTSHCSELKQWRFYKAVEQLEKIEMDNLLANCVCHSCLLWCKKLAQDDLGQESWYNFFRGRLRHCSQLRKFIRKHRVRCFDCFACRAACFDLASDTAVTCVELYRWQQKKALETVELAKKRTWNWHREIELCQRVEKVIQTWERHWEFKSCKLYYGKMQRRKYARASMICYSLQKPAAQVWPNEEDSPVPLEHSDAEISEPEISRLWSWPIGEPGISRSLSWPAAWRFRGSRYESMIPIGMIHQELDLR